MLYFACFLLGFAVAYGLGAFRAVLICLDQTELCKAHERVVINQDTYLKLLLRKIRLQEEIIDHREAQLTLLNCDLEILRAKVPQRGEGGRFKSRKESCAGTKPLFDFPTAPHTLIEGDCCLAPDYLHSELEKVLLPE